MNDQVIRCQRQATIPTNLFHVHMIFMLMLKEVHRTSKVLKNLFYCIRIKILKVPVICTDTVPTRRSRCSTKTINISHYRTSTDSMMLKALLTHRKLKKVHVLNKINSLENYTGSQDRNILGDWRQRYKCSMMVKNNLY